MEYRIAVTRKGITDPQACLWANGRKDLFQWFQILKGEPIFAIAKTYKNGTEYSVIDQYEKYITRVKE